MITPSLSLLNFMRQACRGQLLMIRRLTTSANRSSGHSRWSTIKHDKAKADAKKNRNRSMLAQHIELITKLYGPDPEVNPRLKQAIADAKKQGFPKESVETAIKRGQGLSTTGKPLEFVTIDAVFPSSVAAIIECQTESKAKTLMAVRTILTKHSAQQSPTQFLFKRRGSIVLKPLSDVSIEAVLESALEVAGFEDIVDEGGVVGLISEPNTTKAVADAVNKIGAEVESLEIVWQPTDYVELPDGEDAANIYAAIEKIEDLNEVREVYLNIHRGNSS